MSNDDPAISGVKLDTCESPIVPASVASTDQEAVHGPCPRPIL